MSKPNHVWVVEQVSDEKIEWDPIQLFFSEASANRERDMWDEVHPDSEFRVVKYRSTDTQVLLRKGGK